MQRHLLITTAVLTSIFGLGTVAHAISVRRHDVERIRHSRRVFHQIMSTPDKAIPQELLESAKCIAIIPAEKNFAFIFGGEYGKGVAMCRTNTGWSAPAFLTISGGSFGFQIGGSSTDLVMIFRERRGVQHLLSDKFKIGADATADAGPVGRHVSAGTDLWMHDEILTYSRSRGIFAGVSLSGDVVEPDRSSDRALYGAHAYAEGILRGKVPVPKVARRLVAEIERDTRGANSRGRAVFNEHGIANFLIKGRRNP